MRILGIHDGHNAAAALVVDGEVVAAVQEERFNRVKNWNGFPSRAVEWVLNEGGLAPADLDSVALASLHMPYPRDRETMLEEYRKSGSLPTRMRRLARHTGLRSLHGRRRRAVRFRDAAASGLPQDLLRFVEHHSCHASAAYYGWGRHDDPVLVLTNDGAGD